MSNFQREAAAGHPGGINSTTAAQQRNQNKMARISKLEIQRRQERAAKTERAFAALTNGFARMIRKHVENVANSSGATALDLSMTVDPEGRVVMSLRYAMTVEDRASFPLDDGQAVMPLAGAGGPPPDEQGGGDGGEVVYEDEDLGQGAGGDVPLAEGGAE